MDKKSSAIFAFVIVVVSLVTVVFAQEDSTAVTRSDFVNGTCYNRLDVPNYFWDWLLLPQTLDELTTMLQQLYSVLNQSNNIMQVIDLESVSLPTIGQQLLLNYFWSEAEGTGGGYVPLSTYLQEMLATIDVALVQQEQVNITQCQDSLDAEIAQLAVTRKETDACYEVLQPLVLQLNTLEENSNSLSTNNSACLGQLQHCTRDRGFLGRQPSMFKKINLPDLSGFSRPETPNILFERNINQSDYEYCVLLSKQIQQSQTALNAALSNCQNNIPALNETLQLFQQNYDQNLQGLNNCFDATAECALPDLYTVITTSPFRIYPLVNADTSIPGLSWDLTSFEILTGVGYGPFYGEVSTNITGTTLTVDYSTQYDVNTTDDSFVYQICSSAFCTQATVYITSTFRAPAITYKYYTGSASPIAYTLNAAFPEVGAFFVLKDAILETDPRSQVVSSSFTYSSIPNANLTSQVAGTVQTEFQNTGELLYVSPKPDPTLSLDTFIPSFNYTICTASFNCSTSYFAFVIPPLSK